MAYPANVDARIAAMQSQLDVDLATGLDSSVLEDLEKLKNIRQSAGSVGGTTYLSNQLFTITTSAVLGSSPALTIPPSTISAKVTIFSDSQSDQWVGRFYRDGTSPTNTTGIPVNNADERQFDSIAGLSAWRFRKLDAIASVTVLVEYWGA
jgi:hypothetical protein